MYKEVLKSILVKNPNTPRFFGGGLQIPADSSIVINSQCSENVRPRQIWKSRFPNFNIGDNKVELSESAQVSATEPFSIGECQFVRQHFNQLSTISSTFFSILFQLYNPSSDVPIGFNHYGIHRSVRQSSAFVNNPFDVADK